MLRKIFKYSFLLRIFNILFTDKEKIILITLNKILNNQKLKLRFNEPYIFNKHIRKLWYANCLTNIVTSSLKIPDSVTKIKFEKNFNRNIDIEIPNRITHINFGGKFNKNIKNKIPNSVTNLILSCSFNQKIEGCIPNSVTHLTFGSRFNQSLKNNIPNSVIRLIFEMVSYDNTNFKQEYIPNSVRNLYFYHTFPNNFEIPDFITTLFLPIDYFEIIEKLPTNLKILYCCEEFVINNKKLIKDNVRIEVHF